uniref:Uncharacterized protein n=1 Tax=Glossina austeni TaxID=7395 RepID=A0A1A9VQH7_GLOAU
MMIWRQLLLWLYNVIKRHYLFTNRYYDNSFLKSNKHCKRNVCKETFKQPKEMDSHDLLVWIMITAMTWKCCSRRCKYKKRDVDGFLAAVFGLMYYIDVEQFKWFRKSVLETNLTLLEYVDRNNGQMDQF